MNLYFRPHPLAPLFDEEREDRDLLLKHVLEEVTGPHFQTTGRVRELIRQAALANLWFFLRCVAGAAGPYDKLNTGLHMDMCNFRSSDHCMAPGAKAFVFLPRDHRKSTIFSHGGDTWEVTRDPDLRIGLVNAIVGRSTGFMNQVQRNIDSNPFYGWLFPEHVPAGSRSERKRWTDKEMVMRSRSRYRVEPTIKPMGAEGAGEGDHFDVLNIDDLLGLGDLTVDMMNSVDMYKKMQWFKTNHRTLLDDWNTSRIVGAATRYGMDDVYQWIVERARACYGYPMPGFKPNPDGEWVIYYRNVIEEGKFIQPETMNEEQYRRLQEDDPWTVTLQYENNPLESKMTEFREYPVKRCGLEMVEGFGYVIVVPGDENYDQKEERIPLNECDVCAGCDPAGTKNGLHSKVCQSAVVVWARDFKGRLFLLYLRNGYWGPFELFDEIFGAAERFQGHIRVFGVESNAMQKILVPLLNEDKLKRQIVCYFSGIPNTGRKDPRIRLTVGKPLQQGKVYAVDSAAIPFVSQKDKFPTSEFQKDILDASEMAIGLTVVPESPEDKEEYEQALEEFAMGRSSVTGY